MPTVRSPRSEPESAQGQIDIITDHQQISRFEIVDPENLLGGQSAQIHVSRRLDQNYRSLVYFTFGRQRPSKNFIEFEAVRLRQPVEDHKAEVVPGSSIVGTGIAKTED